MDQYITVKDVCAALCISRDTLRRWQVAGKLKGYKIGRRVLYNEREVNLLVRASAQRPAGGEQEGGEA